MNPSKFKIPHSLFIVLNSLFCILILAVLLLPKISWAATYTCGTDGIDNSCTSANMASLIASASDGDMINIARAAHAWGAVVNINKRVTIAGGGTCSDCGSVAQATGNWPTQITTNGANGVFQIEVQATGSGRVTISGIRFYGALPVSSYGLYSPYLDDSFISELPRNRADFYLDQNHYHSVGSSDNYMVIALRTMSVETTGLISNSYFESDIANGKHIYTTRVTYAEAQETPCKAVGQTSWSKPIVWGSGTDWLFVENNSFYRPSISVDPNFGMTFDTQAGGKIVFRYNYSYNDWIESHILSYGGWGTSGVALEVYNNTAVWTKPGVWQAWHYHRSGALLYYNNNVSGNYQNVIKLSGDGRRGSVNLGNWGTVDGTRDWDGNCQAGSTNPRATNPSDCGQPGVPYPIGYPSIDQPGRGKHFGTFSCSNPGANIQPQELLPVRFWSNTNNVLGAGGACESTPHGQFLCLNGANYFVINRDYYYSTDNTASEPGYTAYTFPHPWRSVSISDTTPPAAPIGVTVS